MSHINSVYLYICNSIKIRNWNQSSIKNKAQNPMRKRCHHPARLIWVMLGLMGEQWISTNILGISSVQTSWKPCITLINIVRWWDQVMLPSLPGFPRKKEHKSLRTIDELSLIGSLYKIVSKVLAERLKAVIVKLVSNAQNAFLIPLWLYMKFLTGNWEREVHVFYASGTSNLRSVELVVSHFTTQEAGSWTYLDQIWHLQCQVLCSYKQKPSWLFFSTKRPDTGRPPLPFSIHTGNGGIKQNAGYC